MTLRPVAGQSWPILPANCIALAAAAAAIGLDPQAIVAAADVATALPDSLEAARRLPPPRLVAVGRALALAVETCAAEAAGREPPYPHQVELLWMAAAGAPTLAGAMAVVHIFSQALGPRMRSIASASERPWTRLVFADGPPASRPSVLGDFLQLVMLDRLLSWLACRRLDGLRFEIAAPQGIAADLPLALSTRAIAWDAPATALALPDALQDLPNLRSAREVTAMSPLAPVLFGEGPESPHSAEIVRLIDAAIDAGRPLPTLIEIARTLHCSAATLRRRLIAEGGSLQRLKDERRYAWAALLLGQHRLSVAEIGYKMGFGDESTFRRAFTKWTGQSPTRFQIAARASPLPWPAAAHIRTP